jgi:hypothetical protein
MVSATAVRATVAKALRGWKTACHQNYFTSVPVSGTDDAEKVINVATENIAND